MRLICYDEIFKISRPEPTPNLGKGQWAVSIETSKVDDSKNVFLSLESREPVRGRFGTMESMRIGIVCRENTTDFWFYFGGHFMADLNGGQVTYRVDKRQAKRKRFRESNDNEALGLWGGGNSIPFIKEIMDGKNMYVSATPFSESSVEADFEIAGLDEAIKPLREACGW